MYLRAASIYLALRNTWARTYISSEALQSKHFRIISLTHSKPICHLTITTYVSKYIFHTFLQRQFNSRSGLDYSFDHWCKWNLEPHDKHFLERFSKLFHEAKPDFSYWNILIKIYINLFISTKISRTNHGNDAFART